jgi:BON domain
LHPDKKSPRKNEGKSTQGVRGEGGVKTTRADVLFNWVNIDSVCAYAVRSLCGIAHRRKMKLDTGRLMCDTEQTAPGVRTNLVLLDWPEGEQVYAKSPFDQKQLLTFRFHNILENLIMKQLGKYLSAFFLAVTLASVVGCASTSTKEGTGEYIDDTVITTKVKAAIFNEPSLKSAEINVETFKGVVQLSGFVNSRADESKAVELAKGVKGVTSVKNDMRLK